MAKNGIQMKQKIKRKHPHRVKFLQMKKEHRMCNRSTKDLGENIKEITESVKNLSDCTVLKCPQWLCWCTGICCCLEIIATIIVIMLGYVWYPYEPTIIIVCGTILCVLFISASIISLIHIRKISRFVILTAGYERAIQEINKNAHSAEAKIKHTAALSQHYCQSLTKK